MPPRRQKKTFSTGIRVDGRTHWFLCLTTKETLRKNFKTSIAPLKIFNIIGAETKTNYNVKLRRGCGIKNRVAAIKYLKDYIQNSKLQCKYVSNPRMDNEQLNLSEEKIVDANMDQRNSSRNEDSIITLDDTQDHHSDESEEIINLVDEDDDGPHELEENSRPSLSETMLPARLLTNTDSNSNLSQSSLIILSDSNNSDTAPVREPIAFINLCDVENTTPRGNKRIRLNNPDEETCEIIDLVTPNNNNNVKAKRDKSKKTRSGLRNSPKKRGEGRPIPTLMHRGIVPLSGNSSLAPMYLDTSVPAESHTSSFGYNIYNPNTNKVRTGLRPVIIDGSNVAVQHGNMLGLVGKEFSVAGLEICIQYFEKRGHLVKAFIPHHRLGFNSSTNPQMLKKMHDSGKVISTPSRNIRGHTISSYDDRYIVQCAAEFDGVIVSNDNYRDLMNENARWRETIENRLLMFNWISADCIMFPLDPLGRHGPSLERFLRF